MVKIFVQRSFWDMSLELHPPSPKRKQKRKKENHNKSDSVPRPPSQTVILPK